MTTNKAVFRVVIGTTVDVHAPPHPPATPIKGERYRIDFQSYLMSVLGLSQFVEAIKSDGAKPFGSEDIVALGCKQSASVWLWWPHQTAWRMSLNWTPDELWISRQYHVQPALSDTLILASMTELFESFGQSLVVSYFEKHRASIEAMFGSTTSQWPSVWNFGRVVRNAMSHGGSINFTNQNAATVTWKGLSYSPSDNGRKIMHTDLWPGDLFDLILEMDGFLP